MIPKHPSRKPDPFVVLLLAVAIGMSVSIMYQLHVHNNNTLSNIRNAQNVQVSPWNNGSFSRDFVP